MGSVPAPHAKRYGRRGIFGINAVERMPAHDPAPVPQIFMNGRLANS